MNGRHVDPTDGIPLVSILIYRNITSTNEYISTHELDGLHDDTTGGIPLVLICT